MSMPVIDLTFLERRMEWARKVMRGEIEATPTERMDAKQLTFAERYANPGKLGDLAKGE
jgi:hypothetical protein